jgi:hypothetical protein
MAIPIVLENVYTWQGLKDREEFSLLSEVTWSEKQLDNSGRPVAGGESLVTIMLSSLVTDGFLARHIKVLLGEPYESLGKGPGRRSEIARLLYPFLGSPRTSCICGASRSCSTAAPTRRASSHPRRSRTQRPSPRHWPGSGPTRMRATPTDARHQPAKPRRGKRGAAVPHDERTRHAAGHRELGTRQLQHNQVYARVQSFRPWIESTVAVPLRRNVRFRTPLTLSTGTLALTCVSTGETQSASTTVSGLELSVNCPNGSVRANVTLTNPNRFIDGFSRSVNGSVTGLPFTSSSASNTLTVPGNAIVEYSVIITD